MRVSLIVFVCTACFCMFSVVCELRVCKYLYLQITNLFTYMSALWKDELTITAHVFREPGSKLLLCYALSFFTYI